MYCHRINPRWLAGLCLGAMLAPPVAANDPYPEVTVDVSAERVKGTDAYYVIGLTGVPDAENEGFMSNAGFVVTDAGVVVYDALGTPALGYELIKEIRAITDQPIRYVIAGHYHADHIYGLQAFVEHTNAHVIAQANYAHYFAGPGAQQRLEQRRQVLSPWVGEDTRIIRPDLVFEDTLLLKLGDSTIRLMHAGPAHAPDDIIMVVEDSGVVYSGDLIFHGRIPFAGDEHIDSANWIARLEEIEAMDPTFVVPGHGPAAPDAAEAMAFTRGYLEHVRKNMRQAVEDFVPFDEAYENTDWSEYEDLPAFEEANRRNANSIFLELEGEGF
jgi:glyoxylase-like metal-dependent hydrolase (beta-lactamase superfamily II)